MALKIGSTDKILGLGKINQLGMKAPELHDSESLKVGKRQLSQSENQLQETRLQTEYGKRNYRWTIGVFALTFIILILTAILVLHEFGILL